MRAQQQIPAASDQVLIDSAKLEYYTNRYVPAKATLLAAIFPGAGQIYTKKYWKLPLVYGGLIGTGYGVKFYQDGYTKYKSQLFFNLENGLEDSNDLNPDSGFTTSQLRTIVDRYRRERDFMIIMMLGVYVLQMVDAHIDTHLKEFDLNPNLHVRFEPTFSNEMLTGRMGGVSLKFRF